MKFVTISTAFNPADAQLVRMRLEAAGFTAMVKHEGSAVAMEGYAMAAGGILVQVPEEEAEEALAFLAAPDVAEDSDGGDEELPRD